MPSRPTEESKRGVSQAAGPPATHPPFDWFFWFQWLMVTTMGWILGTILAPPIDLLVSGIAIGGLQWVVLQHQIRHSRRWILASSLGWAAGWLLVFLAVPADLGLVAGLILGATTGSAQWFVLRRQVHWAGWWPLVSSLAWATGLGLVPGIFVTAVAAGAMTGVALELLLRTPRQSKAEEQSLS